MQRLLDAGTGREKSKCKLWYLPTGDMSLKLYQGDIETITTGFEAIFSHLRAWGVLRVID